MQIKYLVASFVLLYLQSVSRGVVIIPDYQSLQAPVGQPIILPCKLQTSSKDAPLIQWFKGDTEHGVKILEVSTAGKVKTYNGYKGRLRRAGQANLEVISPDLADTGNYTCHVLIMMDDPPNAFGTVFLQVTAELGKKEQKSGNYSADYATLAVAVLDTVAFLIGYIEMHVWSNTKFTGSLRIIYRNMNWVFLCLVGGTTSWIHFTLSIGGIFKDSLKAIGIVLTVIGVLLGALCQISYWKRWKETKPR